MSSSASSSSGPSSSSCQRAGRVHVSALRTEEKTSSRVPSRAKCLSPLQPAFGRRQPAAPGHGDRLSSALLDSVLPIRSVCAARCFSSFLLCGKNRPSLHPYARSCSARLRKCRRRRRCVRARPCMRTAAVHTRRHERTESDGSELQPVAFSGAPLPLSGWREKCFSPLLFLLFSSFCPPNLLSSSPTGLVHLTLE